MKSYKSGEDCQIEETDSPTATIMLYGKGLCLPDIGEEIEFDETRYKVISATSWEDQIELIVKEGD